MLLRRVAEHVRTQNWTAIAIDLVIVIVGVFIGLQVQEWSAGQNDRQRERQIMADMLADLKIDREQYANAHVVTVQRIAAINASLTGAGLPPVDFDFEVPYEESVKYRYDGITAEAAAPGARDRLWTDVVIVYFPTPSTSTFDLIVGSGDIAIIRDRELVRAIQLYRNLTSSLKLQNEKLLPIRQDTMAAGARVGLAPYVDIPVERYFELVASSPDLAAHIRILATFTIFQGGEIDSADEQAARLEDRLRRALEELP